MQGAVTVAEHSVTGALAGSVAGAVMGMPDAPRFGAFFGAFVGALVGGLCRAVIPAVREGVNMLGDKFMSRLARELIKQGYTPPQQK